MRCRVVLAVFLAIGTAAMARAQEWKSLLEKKTFESKSGKLSYRFMTPAQVEPKSTYPLVIFLHGAGERGGDNEAQLKHGVKDFASEANRKKYPCYLIAPQCPGNKWWAAGGRKPQTSDSDPLSLVMELIAETSKEYPIDSKRIYITGLSMGGFGTWEAIVRKPDLFAAAAPVCGGGNPKAVDKIAKLPIWVFHGAKDPVVKPELSRTMIEALKAVGGSPKYTEYPNADHDSWTQTYRDPEFMKWLFAQKRS